MSSLRQRLFLLAALLAMSCELQALRMRDSYTLPRLRPRARNIGDINAATATMGGPQAAEDVGNGRDFYKKFMLFRDMFQQPTSGNVIVITQPASTGTGTPTTTTTSPTTTTTTTTTSTPTTNSTSRSAGHKRAHTFVQNAPDAEDENVDDVDAAPLLDDRLDRLEMVPEPESDSQPKRKQKHKQQKQKRRKNVKQRKVNEAQKQIRKLKKRHRHIKHKNANKTRQKQQQQQQQQQQQHTNNYNYNKNNNNDNYNRIENANTSSRLQQMWQALRRQTAAATPVERGRSQRRSRSRQRSRVSELSA